MRESVRVVGTNTLRKAKRKGAFLDRAREALGHPIEIISGVEEARLIYIGVAHTTPGEPGHRLVVDIGGGSTELIVGEGFSAKRLESLYMGCVSLTVEHFPDGVITEKRMKRARTTAQLELEPIVSRFRRSEWDSAFGASGTLRAASDIMVARGSPNGHITREGVEAMVEECLKAGDVTRLKLPGLTQDRQEIFPAGLAIMIEIFERLGVESMRVADGALREGLLYDLLGRLTDEDARARSVRAMEARYHVDAAQADRVEATVLTFLRQVRESWGLDQPLAELARAGPHGCLAGLDISHSHYHRHGAYLLQHADLPGAKEGNSSSRRSWARIGKLNTELIHELIPPWHLKAGSTVLLRLSVLLHRGRTTRAAGHQPETRGRTLEIEFRGWLASTAYGGRPEQEANTCRLPGSARRSPERQSAIVCSSSACAEIVGPEPANARRYLPSGCNTQACALSAR